MPTRQPHHDKQQKTSTRRDDARRQSAAEAQLIALATLAVIIFALLVTLILVVKEPEQARLFPAAEGYAGENPNEPARIPLPAPQDVKTFEYAYPNRPPLVEPKRKELVFVIDDVGNNDFQILPFLKFPGPITFAIMPGLPCTRSEMLRIREAGKSYILHQPIESLGKLSIGPGGIYGRQSPEQIRSILRRNAEQLPGLCGINNHMGSIGTKNLELMREVLRFAKERDLYYLDSRTIGNTATAQAAALEGATYWERDVFLDNKPERSEFEARMRDGLAIADRHGRAIMIGHVWSAELAQTLIDFYPELVKEGYTLTDISRIITGTEDEDIGD